MERAKETAVIELEKRIQMWKELQANHSFDSEFFHYSQKKIDRLEDRLAKISRLENWNEYLSV